MFSLATVAPFHQTTDLTALFIILGVTILIGIIVGTIFGIKNHAMDFGFLVGALACLASTIVIAIVAFFMGGVPQNTTQFDAYLDANYPSLSFTQTEQASLLKGDQVVEGDQAYSLVPVKKGSHDKVLISVPADPQN